MYWILIRIKSSLLLSNRVHPSRENTQFIHFRPLLHDLIIDVMKNS